MSTEQQFRVGQIGTVFDITMREEDPNDVTQTIVIDLTNNDSIGIEFRRPNKTTFEFNTKSGDPNEVVAPDTLVVLDAVNGIMRFTDKTGVFNVKGRWAWRGIYNEDVGGVIERYPGSWHERMVGI